MFLGVELLNYDYELENSKHVLFKNTPYHIEKLHKIAYEKIVPLDKNIIDIKSFIKIPAETRTFYFDFASANPLPDDIKKIKEFKFSSVKTIQIDGFASNEGTDEFNIELSNNRAIAFSKLIDKSFKGEVLIQAHGEKDCNSQKVEMCRKVQIKLSY